ncbi:hypothetical protein CLV37_106172 [Kineococcus rhizosphaerae]|uniref:Uncharacterized protein n=1 Tax=Kineococcus rhizosphaerae TaxID=559628 RepID=A0A2T0R3J3_9ACTN|nr:hypothetical protein CLV37_106172 [Kineococcus rhizosphaerae]
MSGPAGRRCAARSQRRGRENVRCRVTSQNETTVEGGYVVSTTLVRSHGEGDDPFAGPAGAVAERHHLQEAPARENPRTVGIEAVTR